MTDLSFNIIALDKAGATFVRLADQVDKLSDKLDRLGHKDVTANVNVKTDESRKALDSFSTRWKLMASGITAASPAIGAALVAGVGAGFISVAAIAQHSNAQVQDSYKNLWRDVVNTTQNATDQVVPALVGAANQMDAAVAGLGPQLSRAFSFAGPDIAALTRGITTAATQALPGLTTAMQNSLPVTEGLALTLGQLGAAGGNALASLSQHSSALGIALQSFGSIAGSVLNLAVQLVGDLAEAWAANAGSINSAISGLANIIGALASGALPALTTALGAAANVLSAIANIIAPIAPLLGGVAGAALTLWAAMKVSNAVTTGISLLGSGITKLSGYMSVMSLRGAGMVASMRGVQIAASGTAIAVAEAGAATAAAASTIGRALSVIAGPLGIVLTIGAALFAAFSSASDDAGQKAQQLAADTDTLTQSLVQSHGAVNQSVEDALRQTTAFKDAAQFAKVFGLSTTEMAQDALGGSKQLKALRDQLVALNAQQKPNLFGRKVFDTQIASLNELIKVSRNAEAAAKEQSDSQQKVARTTVSSAQFQRAAAATGHALGLSLGEVNNGYIAVIASGQAASNSVEDVTAAFLKQRLAIAQAQTAISDHFQQADKAVADATRSAVDAMRGVQAASRSVADAQHQEQAAARSVADAQRQVGQAQRSLRDAYDGVKTAQQSYVRAQQDERKAQQDLHEARQQAIRDLKELHLQLADQQVSELQARVQLFDAQQAAAKLGVTPGNANDIAHRKVTAQNEEQIKAALDLLSAQNSLNSTLNTGKNLRQDVARADRAGVDGARGVVSAQQAVKSAQEQVLSAEKALLKAHQQVTDASYSLTKAQQGVADASYGLQKAHQAVADAQYAQSQASERVRQAQVALRLAQEAASRSLDINTKAGQSNLQLLLSLWDAIQKTGMPRQQAYNTLIDDTARAMGISTTKAAAYLKKLGLIPKNFKYSVTAVAGADLNEIIKKKINGTSIFATGTRFAAVAAALPQGRAGSGAGFATGGRIAGPGGPKDDRVPIWASSGEFMQPAEAVSHYGLGVMEAMRSKRLKVFGHDGAMMPGFGDGGLISPDAAAAFAAYANVATAYLSNVNALEVMGLPHPKQLPKYVPRPPAAVSIFGFGNAAKGYHPGAGVAQWSNLVLRVLAELHQSRSLLPNVLRRMNQESGGNPRAINLWDSNAARGTPSIGLMQTIGPTFSAYAGPYRGRGIYDPLANIYAGLNYAIHRYPSLAYAMDKPGGYRNGGWLMPGQLGYNETSKPEAVFTQDQMAKMGQGNVKVFNLHAHVTNRPVDLVNQFRTMELAEGLL